MSIDELISILQSYRSNNTHEERSKVIWIEEYMCGCWQDFDRKSDVLGYCPTHGADRRFLFGPFSRRLVASSVLRTAPSTPEQKGEK